MWRLTLACSLAVSGCQLVGYGVEHEGDAGGLAPDDANMDGGSDVKVPADAAQPSDASTSDGSASDSSARDSAAYDSGASDSGSQTPTDAQVDSGTACSSPNACGGCSQLSSAPATSCGVCGLGRFACSGSDSLVCNGGDTRPRASSTVALIDDFEDGDSNVLASSGFDGYWFAYSDGSAGTLEPPDGARMTPANMGAAGTARSAHLKGSGFTTYGAGLILRINAAQCSVDVSSRRGIGFWLKGKSPMVLSVATAQTREAQYCGTNCDDHFNAPFTPTSTWQHYTLAFSSLKQTGWGTPVSFDASQVQYFQFSFVANTSFELYLDELAFY